MCIVCVYVRCVCVCVCVCVCEYGCVCDVVGFVCLLSGAYKDKNDIGVILILDGGGEVEDR
jgi:hypothetical protein